MGVVNEAVQDGVGVTGVAYDFSEDQNRSAAGSQQRFSAAQEAGKFDAEIVAVEVKCRRGSELFARDERNRPDTTTDSLKFVVIH